jgi:hypothetical protein
LKKRIHHLPADAKASSVPRNQARYATTPILAPDKAAWGAPDGHIAEVEMPHWEHEKYEPLKRVFHEGKVHLPGKKGLLINHFITFHTILYGEVLTMFYF